MSTATIDGHRVTHARVHVPGWGVPWADVTLDGEETLSGRVTLQLADLAWSGSVVSEIGRAHV